MRKLTLVVSFFLIEKKSTYVDYISGRQDSNLRPQDPQPCILAIWTTPRYPFDMDMSRNINSKYIFLLEFISFSVSFYQFIILSFHV